MIRKFIFAVALVLAAAPAFAGCPGPGALCQGVPNGSGGASLIAFNTSQDFSYCASGITCSNDYTVSGGTNRLLVVGLYSQDGIDSVTFDGVPMTLAIADTTTLTRSIYYYYLLGPHAGTHPIVINASAGLTITVVLAADYTGVKQTGQPDNTHGTSSIGTVLSLTGTMTTTAPNAWSMVLAGNNGGNMGGAAGGTGVTERMYDHVSQKFMMGDSNVALAPGAHNQTVTNIGADTIALLQISFAPAP